MTNTCRRTMRRSTASVDGRFILLVIFTLATMTNSAATPAYAQSRPESSTKIMANGPWDRDVTRRDQLKAHAIFAKANDMVKDALYIEAVKRYKAALQIWNHPAIHFNLAIALQTLGRSLAAYRSLRAAVKYGMAPLGKSKHEYAQRIIELLAQEQLGHIEIACDDEGAEVHLDGALLFIGPGEKSVVVEAGPHQIVARKVDRYPDTQPVTIKGGQHEKVVLRVKTAAVLRKDRYWGWWTPLAVAAGGATLVASASGLHQSSAANFKEYDTRFTALCDIGCLEETIDPDVAKVLKSARRQQNLSRVGYSLGGSLLVAAALLAYLNRERIIQAPGQQAERAITITPKMTPNNVLIQAYFSF